MQIAKAPATHLQAAPYPSAVPYTDPSCLNAEDRGFADICMVDWSAKAAERNWNAQLREDQGRCTVGILCSREDASGAQNNYVNNYAQAVIASGGQPRLIYPDRGSVEQQTAFVDALVVPGGQDIDPVFYGGTKGPGMKNSRTLPGMDAFEIGVLQEAFDQGTPLLGICRGEQLINVAGGGTLTQDIPTEFEPVKGAPKIHHNGGYEAVHPVRIKAGSRLRETLGTASIVANSVHHQCIAAISPLFRVVAYAMDGVPEAIERRDLPTQVGVQFHPERARKWDPTFQRLFDRLVDDGVEYHLNDHHAVRAGRA